MNYGFSLAKHLFALLVASASPLAVTISFTMGFCTCLRAHTYQVEGVAAYSWILESGVQTVATNAFSVQVKDCRWLISARPLTNEKRIEKGYQDGVICNLTEYANRTNRSRTNIYFGLIEKDDIPDEDGSMINFLWLAFASQCYFDQLPVQNLPQSVRPICCLDDRALREERFMVNAYFTRDTRVPNLPDYVAFLNDGFYRAVNKNRERVVFKAAAPFDQGYTNIVYHALSFTNFNGISLPLACESIRYAAPGPASTNKDLWIRMQLICRVDKVSSALSSSTMLPAFNGEFRVLDNRFRNAAVPLRQTNYKISNGNWFNVPLAEAAYKATLEHQRHEREVLKMVHDGHATKRSSIFAVLFVLTVIFVILAARSSRESFNSTTNHPPTP